MNFGDMLTYEENCVKEAMALPNLEITITVYDTFSDCETCGSYGTTVLEVEGDLGITQSGYHASCLGCNDDGSYYEVAEWINSRLEQQGRPAPTLLTPDAKNQADAEYYAQVAVVCYDYCDPSLKDLAEIAGCLSDAFDAYYTLENLTTLYAAFGVTVHNEYRADEIYDASDWGDDNEEEECQDD